MAAETAAQRYDREWLHMSGGRKVRGMDNMSTERRVRLFVERTTGVTATAVGDNLRAPNPN